LRRLLPDRKAPESAFQDTSEYTVELLVPADNPHIGKTIAEAGLMNVPGGNLIEVIHFDEVLSPVPDDEPVMGGDRLVYAGQIDEILDLKKTHGFVNATEPVFRMDEVDTDRRLLTAFVPFHSPLIRKAMGHTSFEKDNNMTLLPLPARASVYSSRPMMFGCKPATLCYWNAPGK